jgi:hypothetical protein
MFYEDHFGTTSLAVKQKGFAKLIELVAMEALPPLSVGCSDITTN